jgi:hypothetical protein
LAAVSFLALYQISIKVHDPWLDHFWSDGFVEWSHPLQIPLWFLRKTYGLCDHPYVSLGALSLLLVIMGIAEWWKNRGDAALKLCLFPIGLTLLAAAAHRFPYTGDRITVFLIPELFLLAGAGFLWLHRRIGNWALVAVTPLLISGLVQSSYHLIVPRTLSDIRPAVQYVRAHREPVDPMYVVEENGSYSPQALEFFCYWHSPPGKIYHGLPPLDAVNYPRFWLIFPFDPHRNGWQVEPVLRQIRQSFHVANQSINRNGGAAFLFERTATAGR